MTNNMNTNEKPKRIQLSQDGGWRMPENTVSVDRTTEWGNPFIVDPESAKRASAIGMNPMACNTQAEAVEKFRHMMGNGDTGEFLSNRVRENLRGLNLACWCKIGTPCHADVLLEIANG